MDSGPYLTTQDRPAFGQRKSEGDVVKQTNGKPRRVGDGTPGPGRPKGSQNRTTKALKDMILTALDEADPEGSIEYLKKQATANPTAFLTLVGKVLPLDVNANHGGKVVAEVVFKGLNA